MSAPSHPGVGIGSRPIVCLTLSINYAFGEYSVWGYHVFNFMIHILCGITLYGVLCRSFLSNRLEERFGSHALVLAWITAAIWIVHPIQTGAVTYIIQRCESLMGLFYLLTLYAAIRSEQSEKPKLWWIISILCCGLGMGTKEAMMTAPVVVLFYDRTFMAGGFKEAFRKRWPLYLGLSATWIIVGFLLTQGPHRRFVSFSTDISALDYALTQSMVIIHYVFLSLWPAKLCFDYSWPVVQDWTEALPSMIFIFLTAALTIYGFFRNRTWSFLGIWFFCILSVTSSFFPLLNLAFEHRMYLPLISIILTIVTGAYPLLLQFKNYLKMYSKYAYTVVIFIGIVVVCVLCWRTILRNRDYRSEISIWETVVKQRPNNFRAHVYLGSVLRKRGDLDAAIECYNRAIEIKPEEAGAYSNLGIALAAKGKLHEAVKCYQQALELSPDYAPAHNNLAMLYQRQGKFDEAILHYRRVVKTTSYLAQAYNNLGVALLMKGKLDEALENFKEALRIDKNSAVAMSMSSRVLIAHPNPDIRDIPEAIRLAERAAELTRYQHPAMLNTLAAAYATKGQYDKAAEISAKALALAYSAQNINLINQIRKQLNYYQSKMSAGKIEKGQ
jgi:tetratricopeptide (TPR) repeat protein